MLGFFRSVNLIVSTVFLVLSAFVNSAIAQTAISVTKLAEYDHVLNGAHLPYQLIQIARAGYRDAFVQYFPPPAGGPVVVVTDPYSGIDWSTDSIDQKWAVRPNASTGYIAADEESIWYTVGASKPIAYRLASHAAQASNVADIYLFNRIGVMIVYGRYYRGTTLQQFLDDSTSGFHFLSRQNGIDKTRIAVTGNSLGGFMAAHGAARASEAGLTVKAGALLSPALDFSDFLKFHFQLIPGLGNATTTQAHINFCDPHLRRILPIVSGLFPWQGGDYSKYSASYLQTRLSGKFLIFHDEWDTMAPYATSANFVSQNSAVASAFWYQHSTAPDFAKLIVEHAPDSPRSGLDQGSLNLFSTNFIMSQLQPAGSSRVLLYLQSDVFNFIVRLRALQLSGKNISWIVPRLIELAEPNIKLISVVNTNDVATGEVLVSYVVNGVWGLSTTPQNVKAYLMANGLR